MLGGWAGEGAVPAWVTDAPVSVGGRCPQRRLPCPCPGGSTCCPGTLSCTQSTGIPPLSIHRANSLFPLPAHTSRRTEAAGAGTSRNTALCVCGVPTHHLSLRAHQPRAAPLPPSAPSQGSQLRASTCCVLLPEDLINSARLWAPSWTRGMPRGPQRSYLPQSSPAGHTAPTKGTPPALIPLDTPRAPPLPCLQGTTTSSC